MLKGEKGVTRIVLAIGIIITVVMVLIIGVYMMAPLVKANEEFVAKDAALYMNTLLAAPEDITLTLTLSDYSDKKNLGVRFAEPNFMCSAKVGFLGIARHENCKIFTTSKNTVIEEIFFTSNGKIKKSYNPSTQKNKIKKS